MTHLGSGRITESSDSRTWPAVARGRFWQRDVQANGGTHARNEEFFVRNPLSVRRDAARRVTVRPLRVETLR